MGAAQMTPWVLVGRGHVSRGDKVAERAELLRLLIVQAWRRTPGHYSAHESPDDPLRTAGGIEFYYSEASLSWYARWPEHGFSFEERLAAGHAGAAAFPEATKVMGP